MGKRERKVGEHHLKFTVEKNFAVHIQKNPHIYKHLTISGPFYSLCFSIIAAKWLEVGTEAIFTLTAEICKIIDLFQLYFHYQVSYSLLTFQFVEV